MVTDRYDRRYLPSRPIAYAYMSHVFKVHEKEVKLLYCQPSQPNEIVDIRLLQTKFTFTQADFHVKK